MRAGLHLVVQQRGERKAVHVGQRRDLEVAAVSLGLRGPTSPSQHTAVIGADRSRNRKLKRTPGPVCLLPQRARSSHLVI